MCIGRDLTEPQFGALYTTKGYFIRTTITGSPFWFLPWEPGKQSPIDGGAEGRQPVVTLGLVCGLISVEVAGLSTSGSLLVF